MQQEGMAGAKTVLDVPPIMLNINSRDEVIKKML